jgi:hypothetical protein
MPTEDYINHNYNDDKDFPSKPHPSDICADCGHRYDDVHFHLEAPGTNWGAALHHFVPIKPPQDMSPKTHAEETCVASNCPDHPTKEPAQVCNCHWIYDDGAPFEPCSVHPATPAPSQPAGAREFRLQWSHKPTIIPPNATGLWYSEECTDELMVAYAAAKDAEIEKLVKQVEFLTGYGERRFDDAKKFYQRAEAPERERDSLREDNDEAYRQLGLEDYEGEDGLAHHIAILQAQNAALKQEIKDVRDDARAAEVERSRNADRFSREGY